MQADRLDTASPFARYLVTNQAAGVPTPDAAVIPALASIFETEVTLLGRVTAQSARVCIAFRLTTLSCLTCAKQISPYESRSLGYRSRTDIRCSAPSPRNLTGKLFRSYSIEPFMVELFTAGRLTRSPEWSFRCSLSPKNSSPRQPR